MAYDYSDLLARAQAWATASMAEGRLQASRAEALMALDARSPRQLFAEDSVKGETRPLIVAFMGGTGVGKSSLLNRLAGQPIAKAGVVRPTSREVTLYHHHAFPLQQLPGGLPLDSIHISQHHDANNSHVVWIDMPDFDSVELANKQLVLQWLPHIDVLLYVVSPERYRDNKAWQLLLAEGAKHAWLFVMNQWDRGVIEQFEDFQLQLAKAGFAQPLIFRTSCSEPDGDEFAGLLAQLKALAGQQNRIQLERRSQQWRRQALHNSLQQLAVDFAKQSYGPLNTQLQAQWQVTQIALEQGLAWPMEQLAQAWVNAVGSKHDIRVWDDWAQQRLQDLLDDVVQQAAAVHLPSKPLKQALQAIGRKAEKAISGQVELAGRQAMLQPGNGLQRALIKLCAIAEWLLPVMAMAWVGYQVFTGYYHSATTAAAYLGGDFAIHSGLLIGLSWLMPFFLHKKLQPSMQKAAVKGLQKGLRQALMQLLVEIQHILAAEQRRQDELRQQLLSLLEQCGAEPMTQPDKDSLLERVLIHG